MKIFSFWRTAGVALTAFTLLFSACENGTQEIEGTVKATAIPAPKVTTTVSGSGVTFKWPLIDDAKSYTVYRTEQGKPEEIRLGTGYTTTAGYYGFFDGVKDADDSIKPNTKYSYTVIASPISGALAHSKTVVNVATKDFLPKGTQLKTPSVSLAIDEENNMLVATITPAADEVDIALAYFVEFKKDGSTWTISGSGEDAISSKQTVWGTESKISLNGEGTYTATVKATPDISSGYHLDSVSATSNSVSYESLGGSITASNTTGDTNPSKLPPIMTGDTITGYSAKLTLSSFKKDVAYTVERALVTNSVVGTYETVTLKRENNSDSETVDISSYTTSPDLLGFIPSVPTTLYDRGIPAAGGTYQYRVKAVKGGKTQYSATSSVTISPRQYLNVSVNVEKDTTTSGEGDAAVTTNKYTFTPSVSYKDILDANEKLVIYYTDVGASVLYGYTHKIEFTKTEIEAKTSKDFTLAKTTATSVPNSTAFYLIARLERTVDGVTATDHASLNGDVADNSINND